MRTRFYKEYWGAQPMGAANLPLVCTGPISYRGQDAIQADIANFTAALAGAAEVHKDGRTDFLRRGEDYATEYRPHPHHPRREFGTSARSAGGVASQGSRPTLRS